MSAHHISREISGSADFRRAVQETANWGKALTKELIRLSQLLQVAYNKKSEMKLAQEFNDYMKTEHQKALQQKMTTEDLVWLLKGQQFQVGLQEGIRTIPLDIPPP